MDIDTRLLRSFAAVVDEGQLTAAASRLAVSQPALTKQIRQLEGLLGVRLFERSRAGMAPTRAGHALAERLPDLMEAWSATLRAVRGTATAEGGVLRVGFEGSTINLVGLATVRAFGLRMPGWQVGLRQYTWFDSSSGLDSGELDLALWHAPLHPDGEAEDGRYGCAPLGLDERWAVLPAGHRLAGRTEIDLADLLDEEFVAIPARTGLWRDYWLGADGRDGRPVRIGAVAHSTDEWLAAVACGQGVGLAPASVCLASGRPDVVHRPVRGLAPSRAGLYWRADRPLGPAAEAFVRSCRETVTADGRVRAPGSRGPEGGGLAGGGLVGQSASNGSG